MSPPISYLHGGRVLWALAIIAINYCLVHHAHRITISSRSLFLPLLWLVNVLLLFA